MREPEGVALIRKGKSNYITAEFAWGFFCLFVLYACLGLSPEPHEP